MIDQHTCGFELESLTCTDFTSRLQSPHSSSVGGWGRICADIMQGGIDIDGRACPQKFVKALSLRRSCAQPTLQLCVGASLVETVHHGWPQMKAAVPDSAPRPERKSLNAQALGHLPMWSVIWALKENVLNSLQLLRREALMSDLSCTNTLVIFGWLHTWETLNRTQTQGLRRTSGPADGKGYVAKDAPSKLIGSSKRDYS